MSSLAVGEGYRATENELLARDASARRAAIDELLSAVPADGRGASRLRRLAMRFGLEPDASYRVAAILPGPDADPNAGAARHRRRRPRDDGPADRPIAPSSRPLRRRRECRDPRPARRDLARRDRRDPRTGPPRVAAAAGGRDEGVRVGSSVVDRDRHPRRRRDSACPVAGGAARRPPVADGIDRRGVIDDLSELGIERLLLE